MTLLTHFAVKQCMKNISQIILERSSSSSKHTLRALSFTRVTCFERVVLIVPEISSIRGQTNSANIFNSITSSPIFSSRKSLICSKFQFACQSHRHLSVKTKSTLTAKGGGRKQTPSHETGSKNKEELNIPQEFRYRAGRAWLIRSMANRTFFAETNLLFANLQPALFSPTSPDFAG